LNTGQFLTQVFTCTCEISYGRGNQTQKPKRLSPLRNLSVWVLTAELFASFWLYNYTS